MSSDETLLLQFQRGSQPALEELFARHQTALRAFFARRLANQHRADDLVQDVFIAVIRGSSRYEPRSSVRAYLYGIAFRVLMAERRTQRDRAEQWVSQPDVAGPANLPDRALWVKQALQRLDEDDREILMLREYEQLSYAEIATLLRMPINTVRSRLFRSRLILRDLLDPSLKTLGAREGADAG